MKILATLSVLLLTQFLWGQEIQTLKYDPQTHPSLELDLYSPERVLTGEKPLFIFVHGGGFRTGERSEGNEICQYLSEHGFYAATISYELYMKDKSFSCDGILTEKVKAIQLAVNNLWTATAFLLAQENLSIDANQVYIAGSSAGAETALQAAFWKREVMSLSEHGLSADFRYAGLVSGAGALMDLNLIHEQSSLPILAFHGMSDKIVPYGTAAHHYCETNASGWLMLFGSESIHKRLASLNTSTYLVGFPGKGHDYCARLFFQRKDIVLEFLQRIQRKERFKMELYLE